MVVIVVLLYGGICSMVLQPITSRDSPSAGSLTVRPFKAREERVGADE